MHLLGVLHNKDADGQDEKHKKHSKQLTGGVMLMLTQYEPLFLYYLWNPDERTLFREQDRSQRGQRVLP